MSTETIRKCDVYGTKRLVRAVRVRVEAETNDGEWLLFTNGLFAADAGPRGVKRLMHLITRGLHPPGWSPEDDDEADVADSATTGMDEELPGD